ncbi:hypothetical protein ACEZCY_14730 [Streptacidiphilus sp. N1-12]|uniref:Tail assembly chaperone n=2 Tax=Streptacidiphilus alkalitolerans TaxID=3342712 RepID=A0ABV6WEQ8_9ACTN
MGIERKKLPNGQWADIRDSAEVPERLQRAVRAIQMQLMKDPAFAGVVDKAKAGGVKSVEDLDDAVGEELAQEMTPEAMALLDDLNDRLIVSRVAGWSFEAEVSMDALLDLASGTYEALKELCAKGALSGSPDLSPSTDEESPTGSSTASV